MRNAFYEYYGLSKDEYEKLWNDALIVFDTNVLLSLYRLQLSARVDMVSVMRSFKDRLWIPSQVGYEYHERRLEEACRPIESLCALNERVAKFAKEIEENYGKNPYIKDYKNINRALKSLNNTIGRYLDECLGNCPNFMREDTIMNELTDLYQGKVGVLYSEERLREIFKIGEDRYKNKIPPGYKDTGKKTGDRHRFGDLIIWLQIIEESKSNDCDIIFVTDEKKEDWWQLYNENKIGPRRELIVEFRKKTSNHLVWFYSLDRFLSEANQRKAVSVKKKTIEEVKFSEIVVAGLNKLLGESSIVGQVSIGELTSSPLGLFGESEPDNLSFMSKQNSNQISHMEVGSISLNEPIELSDTLNIKPEIRESCKLEPRTPVVSEKTEEDISFATEINVNDTKGVNKENK